MSLYSVTCPGRKQHRHRRSAHANLPRPAQLQGGALHAVVLVLARPAGAEFVQEGRQVLVERVVTSESSRR